MQGAGECSTDEQSLPPGTQDMTVLPSKRVERPRQIDNSDIVLGVNGCASDEFELRRMLEEGQDYVLVSKEVWEKLFDWYSFFFPFLLFCVHLLLCLFWYVLLLFNVAQMLPSSLIF